jgi:H+/Cl- antiporter ClcA
VEIIRKDARNYRALLPCIVSALLADITASAWGIHHVHYTVAMPGLATFITLQGVLLLLKAAVAGLAFGMAAYLFVYVQNNIKKYSIRYIHPSWLIPVTGGVLIIVMCYLAGTGDYTGLGVVAEHPGGVSIVHAFLPGGAGHWSWLWKLVFTAVTLGTGFKGGEVTPLFFIGATLGNTLSWLGGAPADLFAALGFIAVFAGATKTPLASTLLGLELFGINYLPCYLVACFMAYLCSGRIGIYSSKV